VNEQANKAEESVIKGDIKSGHATYKKQRWGSAYK
jgi:hypothetical protein